HGTKVLDVPHMTLTVDWLSAVFGVHDLVVDDLQIDGGMARIDELPITKPDGQLSSEVGFIVALAPAKPSKPSPPGTIRLPGPIISVRSMSLKNVDLDLNLKAFQAHLHNINTQGVLRQSFRDPAAAMDFTYALSPALGEQDPKNPSTLTILGETYAIA